MKGLLIILIATNAIATVLYFCNIALVLQNLVFTHDTFKTSNVPFYDSSLGEGTTLRYHYHWWEYASDILRITPVILSITIVSVNSAWKTCATPVYAVIMSILFVMELVKSVKRAADWLRCGSFQFCRNYNTNEIAYRANETFILSFILTCCWLVLCIIYLLYSKLIDQSCNEFNEKQKDLKRQVISKPKK